MFRSYRKTRKKKEKRGVLFPFRRVNSIPRPTILTYRSPEGGGEGGSGPVIRAEIYAVALQHSATKHRGRRRGRNKRFQGNSGRCAGIIGPPRLVVLFQVSSIRLISPTTSTSRYSTSVSLLRYVLHSISLLDISSSSRNLPIVPVLIISRRGSTPIATPAIIRIPGSLDEEDEHDEEMDWIFFLTAFVTAFSSCFKSLNRKLLLPLSSSYIKFIIELPSSVKINKSFYIYIFVFLLLYNYREKVVK